MRILLPYTNKDNRLSSSINHIQSCAYLLINRIKFSQNNSINHPWILLRYRKINQTLVELCQLINCIITNQSLTNKQNCIRFVQMDQLSQRPHKGFIALHPARRVNQNHIILFVFGLKQRFLCNNSWIIFISLLIKRKVKTGSVSLELFNCT
jgi:hypothetical protein